MGNERQQTPSDCAESARSPGQAARFLVPMGRKSFNGTSVRRAAIREPTGCIAFAVVAGNQKITPHVVFFITQTWQQQ